MPSFWWPGPFVLAGSGHIAGVINPPSKQKYQHWILEEGDAKVVPTIDAFVAKADEHPGSWWLDYKEWLSSLSGAQITPPEHGGGVFKPLEDAPGSYVRK